MQNLLNAPDGGNSICAGGFNPFGVGNSSAHLRCVPVVHDDDGEQHGGSESNHLPGRSAGFGCELPAGDLQVAVLADHRRNTYEYRPDSQLAAQNIEAVIASQPTQGEISVDEFAAQIDVPLLADKPFLKKLSIGARVSPIRLFDLRRRQQLRRRPALGAE